METIVAIEKYGSNPYYEKWGRGRPSVAKLINRDLYKIWNTQHRKLYPELYPSLTLLLESEYDNKIKVEEIEKTKTVKIRYDQRCLK